MSHGYNIQANWACLSDPSKQNLGSQKATAEDPSDSHNSDWIPMPEMDEFSDSESEDSDEKNENTPRQLRREKYLLYLIDQ